MRIGKVIRGLILVGGLTALLSRSGRRVSAANEKRDPIDEAGKESFPASDPPSWTLGEEEER